MRSFDDSGLANEVFTLSLNPSEVVEIDSNDLGKLRKFQPVFAFFEEFKTSPETYSPQSLRDSNLLFTFFRNP